MEKESVFKERLKTQLQKNGRLMVFFNNKKFTDCTFIVNDVHVKAHKLILACSSPVFEKMFTGDMASSEIIVCDINLDVFVEMLEFIYSDKICISSVAHAWSLFYIAKKYLLDDLTSICLSYINRNVSMSNLVLSYEFADMYNLNELKRKCFTDINNYLKGVFVSDYHMKPSTLQTILLQDSHNMDSLELVIRIIQWSAMECDFQDLPVLPQNIVGILQEFNLLEFIKISFLDDVKCGDCGKVSILCLCLGDLIHKSLLHLHGAIGCDISIKTNEKTVKESEKKLQLNLCGFRKEYKIAKRIDLQPFKENICNISTNKMIMIFAFFVNTIMKPDNCNQDFYDGSITIRVCSQMDNTQIGKSTTVRGTITYDSECYVILKDVIVLYPNIDYEIRLTYRNFNTQPGFYDATVCYYMSNKLKHQCDDSVISFYESHGGIVKGVCFYPV